MQVDQILHREFAINRAAIDKEKRTASVSFSSEEPFERYFGVEILSHNPAHVDMSRLKNGAPLLRDHNRNEQIGVIESAQIDPDGVGRAVVRFSKRQSGQDEFQDVLDGIRTKISVGYQINDMVLEKEEKGVKHFRVTSWLPMEISTVSIPADDSVGVGRACEKRSQIKMENNDAREIVAIGEKLKLEREAMQFIREGKNLDDFKHFAMDALANRNAQPPAQSQPAWEIGMTQRELNRYSLVNVVRAVLFPNEPKFRQAAAFEIDCSNAAAKLSPTETRGIRIPIDVANSWTRTLTAGTATDGAELVATDYLAGSFIDVLRNLSAVMGLGATVINGLVGNVSIPRKTSGASASWLATEGANAANSEPQFDNVTLIPKTLGCYAAMTRQLILQSSPAIEQIVRADLAAAVATAIDAACLYGSGSSGQPQGISTATGINTPTDFAAAVPTWAEVVAMESAVAVDNALAGSLGYIIEPAMAGSLKTTEKSSGTAVYIMEDMGKLNGYRCAVTSQVTSGDLFFGNWRDLILGFWGGLDILSDPYTNSLSGTVLLVAHQSCDVGIRHPVSFAFNNDGA